MLQQYFSILKKKYDQSTFQKFSHELLNDIEVGNTKLSIDSGFQNHIESFIYLGSYQDQQGKNLHILDVSLKTNTKLEQARTMQRNLIAKYLKEHWLDGALVAFHNDNSSSWRLSFVKVEYKYDDKGKPTEELTPARRYSFLVGEGEPSHTAQMQLARIYEQTAQNPMLAQLEEAFGVEKVTKEFFEKYRELFESVVAELKTNHTFQNEASKNNIDTESFAKKLLGQIVFLYFLQKKGWLGVPKGKSWGEGDKMFLRNIYNQAISEKKNFFNNYLEVLFYDTLNNARNDKVDRNYSDFFQSKIPFLNGGLFEPQYDWKNSLMYLDDKLFDKILGVFDTYNFTVKEDEPLEKEVAVDPEMLGKVFENLLEENLRKGKGTYYTPREIVHYMCQESLINYLIAEVQGLDETISNLVKFGEFDPKESPRMVVLGLENYQKLDHALKTIKVVDPACGSGAFLVGMLQEIVKVRSLIDISFNVNTTEYLLKKETIQNCIYGVDIDPGAIEIAKLRLWLSLVVEYDLEQIEPLPNLEYKLMQGNSLLEELVLGDTSIKLYDSESIQKVMGSKRMKTLFEKENQIGLFDGDRDKVMKSLKSLQLKYFSISDSESKKQIRNQIERIEHELIETSVKSSLEELRSQKLNVKIMPGIGLLPDDVKRLEKISSKENQIFAILDELNKTGTKPFFLWHLYFADVFEEKGGFDVVIANPPYIKEDVNKNAFNGLRQEECYQGKMDLWYLFGSKGLDLLKKQGVMCFIATNNWISNDGASKFRNKIIDESTIINYVDFGDYKVFAAGIQTMMFVIKKDVSENVYKIKYGRLKDGKVTSTTVNELLNSDIQVDNNNFTKYSVLFEKEIYKDQYINFLPPHIVSLVTKMQQKGTTKLTDKEVFSGIDVMQDFVNKKHLEKIGNQFKVGQGVFVISNEEFMEIDWNKKERELLKPYYTTKEINRNKADNQNHYWVIYSSAEINRKINEYPNIKQHLDKFKKIITSVNKPYGLHRTRDEQIFLGEKILSIRKCAIPSFSYVTFPCYVSRAFLIIKTDKVNLRYLTILLNSKIVEFWLRYKGKLQGNLYQVDKNPLMSIPLLVPDNQTINELIQENNVEIINKAIYSFYDLTDNEIDIVEQSI